ncbi:MAG: SRPBCC family protein [Gammaproteobacteria bacterium]|nr:SRPBCC family protein [Gammaproteobacteria bacterium]
MELEGETLLHGAPGEVWKALHDAALLKEFVPGCERLEWLDDATLEAELTLRAVGLRRRYASRVHIRDSRPVESYTLLFGSDAETANVASRVRLEPVEAGTHVVFVVEVRLDNTLARLGAGVVERIARKMADRFFKRLDAELTGSGASGTDSS